jgi:hypothetical protein
MPLAKFTRDSFKDENACQPSMDPINQSGRLRGRYAEAGGY